MSTSINHHLKTKPKGSIVLVLLVFLSIISLALNTYSKRNTQILKINKISGPIANPLMGWAPWATILESLQPHTLVYADLTWRSFEPQEGHFDFDTFERKQQLARWRLEGKRVVFRFIADMPGSQTHLDIPDWLFEKIHRAGDYYENEYGKGFSPDYSNLDFIDAHRKTIKALGERYGKDGFFAFIELGSLGHWGEWHTGPEITPLPSEAIRDLYVSHYLEAFPETHLLMRRPFRIAQRLGLGLYNDMVGDLSQTIVWLDWIENGGEYLPGEIDGLSAMPNGWQAGPIGGEQSPILSNEQVYGADLEQTLQLLRNSHTTFIGPNSPYQVENGDALQDGLDQVSAMLGYRIYIDRVQMSRKILYGKNVNIRITMSNDGIAPLYYNWPARVYLLDEKGVILSTYPLQADLTKILPGDHYDIAIRLPVGNLRNGKYSIGMAIVDPITDLPAIRFANENTRQDLIQVLGSFEVRRFFNPN